MEQIIALALGAISSELQGKSLGGLPGKWRYLIAMAVCVAVGLATTFLTNGVKPMEASAVLANIGVAFMSSQTYYNTFFKGRIDKPETQEDAKP